MGDFEKEMDQIFNIDPLTDSIIELDNKKTIIPTQKETLPAHKVASSDLETDLDDAYQKTKDNLEDIIEQGKEAMEEILLIAKEGQHPRAFEVYSGLLKNVIDANKELLNVQKQIRDMDGNNKTVSKTNIDKAVFIGSTTELNKFLKGNNNEQ